MTAILQPRQQTDILSDGKSFWERFCQWVTSTNSRIYIGWFGVLMIPTLLAAAICFLLAFVAAPPVDLDGIRVPVTGALLDGNNLISAAVVPTSAAIGLHFYPIWAAANLGEWLYNGGPYQLIVLHFLIGAWCYLGRQWELSYRMGMRPWIAAAFSAPVAAATAVLLVYPIGQGSFSEGLPLGISGTFHYMLAFQADHNVLMHPLHMAGVIGVFGGALLAALHGSLVSSSLIRATSEDEPIDAGYAFGQSEETYNWVVGHVGYLGRLFVLPLAARNKRSLHFLMGALPTLGIWLAAVGVGVMAFNLNGFNFNYSILDANGRPIGTEADLLNRAALGIQVMHAPNAHNFPQVLAGGVPTSLS